MIRIQCPKCAHQESLEAAEPGSIIPCSRCGQKLRIPVSPKKPPSAPPVIEPELQLKPADSDKAAWRPPFGKKKPNRPDSIVDPRRAKPTEARSERPGAGPKSKDPDGQPDASRRKSGRRALKAIVDDANEQQENEQNLPSSGPWPGKRKKKKKAAEGVNPAHIAMVGAGIFMVLVLTVVGVLIFRSATSKKTYDPDKVLAELEKVGAIIERDQSKPEHPVIGVNLTSRDFDNHVLGGLVAFPELRKLDLSATKTSDVTLEWLEDVTSLQVLNLGHTKVTAGGMQFLTKLVNLEELNLNETIMTDRALMSNHGLFELAGLKKLKRLQLDGTLANGLELKAQIPDLEIIKY
jgi:hypothetical protein